MPEEMKQQTAIGSCAPKVINFRGYEILRVQSRGTSFFKMIVNTAYKLAYKPVKMVNLSDNEGDKIYNVENMPNIMYDSTIRSA